VSSPSDRKRRDSRTAEDLLTPNEQGEAAPLPFDDTIGAGAMAEDHRTLEVSSPVASTPTPIALPLADPGRFHVEDEIGRGGAGRVLRATDRSLGRPVAIKQTLDGAPDLDARFYREMRLTARLQHPGIVPLYDAGRWPNGQPFYAMKLVEGRSLKELLAGCPKLDDRLAYLPKLLSACDAVAYAHAQGIVHRDLKPANVLVGAFGETLVIDWGVAKDLRSRVEEIAPAKRRASVGDEELTTTGLVIGTPAYMPPEQARGEEVDERADVYALGAMLYELLSGRRPYHDISNSSVEVINAVISRAPPPVSEVASNAAPELLAIVELAMHRDREKRYRNAAAMVEDLRRFETGQLVGAHRYSMGTLMRRWVARHRGTVQAAALFVLGGAIAGGVSIRNVVVARNAAEVALVAARDRQDQLILNHARTSLADDPTATLAWLKQLPPGTHQLAAARELATGAYVRGYAEHVWRGAGPVASIAYSRDGKHVAAAFSGSLLLADPRTGRSVQKTTTDALGDIRYAPEGSSLPPDILLAPGPAGALWLLGPDGEVKRALSGHTGSVFAMDFSTDGKTLITGGSDGDVRLWDLDQGRSRVLGTHAGPVEIVRVSPDGKHIAAASSGELRVWNLSDGTSRVIQASKHFTGRGRTYETPGEYVAVEFSPDGRLLASLMSNSYRVDFIPVEGGTAQSLELPEPISSLRYTGDGVLLMGANSGKIYQGKPGKPWAILLEAANSNIQDIALVPRPGRPIPIVMGGASRDRSIELVRPWEDDRFELHGHTAGVTQLRFSADGTRVLSGGADGTLRLWFLRPPYDRTVFTDGPSSTAAISPDGRLIAFATPGAVELQNNVTTSREDGERSIRIGGERPVAVAWAPDGKSVAASQPGGLHLVNVDGTSRRLASPRTLVQYVQFAAGGRALVGADSDGVVWVWEVASGHGVALTTGGPAAGEPAVTSGGDGIAVPLGRRTLIFSARDPARAPIELADGTTHVAVAWSREGDRLAIGSERGGVSLWELSSRKGRVLVDESSGRAVLALGVSPDGREVASLTAGRDLRYVDLATGRVETGPHGDLVVHGASLSADLEHAVAWVGTDLFVWDRPSFTWRSLPGWISNIGDAALSPDGRQLVVTSHSESAERIDIGVSPVPRDGAGLRAWLDATTSTVIETGRLTTSR
jgi:WD40 repeat protein